LEKPTIQRATACGASRLWNRQRTLSRRANVGAAPNALLSGRNEMSSGSSIIGSRPPNMKIASQPKEVTNFLALKPLARDGGGSAHYSKYHQSVRSRSPKRS